MLRRGIAAMVALVVFLVPSSASADYVALGDSFAAGPLIPLQIQPFGCLKSNNNYAHAAQRTLRFAEFRDPSCSGAETEDMTLAQGVTPGPNPPQFDRLQPDTRLVTINIGGNDIGFSSIAEDCFTFQREGSPCRDRYVQNGRDEISERIEATAPLVAAVFQGIHERSPRARVFVLTYAAIFPEQGTAGCWPQMPVADGDVAYLREKQRELNAMLAEQANLNGVGVIDWYEASIGHDACKPPGIRWVEPAVPANAAAPVHPNLFGMLGAARLVEAAATAG
jgi:GDSL-like Lipase/Acylhydrolase family